MVYQRDPAPPPDSDFAPGELHHLVPGNAGRMLDPRRTPVRVAALRTEIGAWVCEVTAFEDRGAHWTLPLESVAHFQFGHGAARAAAGELKAFQQAVRRFDVPLAVTPDARRARTTLAALRGRRAAAAIWLAERVPTLRADVAIDHASRRAPDRTLDVFEAFMRERGLLDMEEALAAAWVTHPGSGETVKGHLIVLAELSLARYSGKILRDPDTFRGEWRRGRRADHILWRMAFVQALLAALGMETLELHRGETGESESAARGHAALVSWSFARAVAEGVAGPAETQPLRSVRTERFSHLRVFMTYLETRAMNARFLEAEAVLFAEDPEAYRDGA